MRGELPCSGRPVGTGRSRGGCIIVEEPSLLGELTADADMSLIRAEPSKPSKPRYAHAEEYNDKRSKNLIWSDLPPVADSMQTSICSVTPSTCCDRRNNKSPFWQSHDYARGNTVLDGSRSEPSSLGWLGPRTCRELQAKSEPDFRCTKKMYEDLLCTEHNHTQNINQYMMDTALLNLRRREMLHRKWTNNVYDPISFKVSAALNPTQRAVCCGLSRDGWPENAARRAQAYSDYLDCMNRKGTVYLDTCDPCEYCPLPPNTYVTTSRLNDPLLSQGRTDLEEDAIALSCITGSYHTRKDIEQFRLFPPVNASGRRETTWKEYQDMPLGNIDSPVRMASRNRMYGNRNHSAIPWGESPPSNEHRYIDIKRPKSTLVTCK